MASSSRSDLLRMAAVIAVLLLVTAALLLVTGGGDGATERASVDGRLTAVTEDELVLEPAAGGPPQTFAIRPVDAPRLDLTHLQQHMQDQLPSRVFYETDGGTRYAVRVDDLPPA